MIDRSALRAAYRQEEAACVEERIRLAAPATAVHSEAAALAARLIEGARERKASGLDFRVEEGPRRPGDPSALVASNRRIKEVLGWRPRHDDLEYIVRTAWHWEQKLQTCGGPEKFGVARGDPTSSRPADS